MYHKEITFICHVAPERFLGSIPDLSNAAFLFQNKVIKALQPSTILSILPLPCIGIKTENDAKMKYFNGRQSKIKLIKLFYDLIDTLIILPKNQINLYYNLNVQNFLILFLSKYFKNSKNFVIIADFEPSNSYKNIFRYILQKMINYCYNYCDGVIILNHNINVGKKSLLFPALVDKDNLPKLLQNSDPKLILFSGSISTSTGIDLAIQAMDYLPEFNLVITGKLFQFEKNELDKLIVNSKYKNIKYQGNLTYQDYQNLLNQCTYTLSLRNIKLIEHQYNFPSKIVEYLSYNKVVVSTKVYEELQDNVILFTEYDGKSLANVIKNHNELICDRRKYVIENFELSIFKNRVFEFIYG